MSKNLHTILTELKAEINFYPFTMKTAPNTLIQATIDLMPVQGSHKVMRETARDALYNVLDRACNSGTVGTQFELVEALEHDYDGFGVTLSADDSMTIAGELWNQAFMPETFECNSDEPIADAVDLWCEDIGRAAQNALIAFMSETYPEFNI